MSKKPAPKSPFPADVTSIDYKDVVTLRKCLSRYNKIIPRYYTGVSVRTQKMISVAIKKARFMALLPYVVKVD